MIYNPGPVNASFRQIFSIPFPYSLEELRKNVGQLKSRLNTNESLKCQERHKVHFQKYFLGLPAYS